VTWTGGDVFSRSRFFIPILPVLSAAAAVLIGQICSPLVTLADSRGEAWTVAVRIPRDSRRVQVVALLMTALLATNLVCLKAMPEDAAVNKSTNRENILVAEGLSRSSVEHDLEIGVFWAGTTPYLMPGRRFHDMLGKSEARIAALSAKRGVVGHNKWDLDYSLGEVAPGLLITSSAVVPPGEARQMLDTEQEYVYNPALMLHPIFLLCYSRVKIRVGAQEPTQRWVYARNLNATSSVCRVRRAPVPPS
jgi:hypothetical protein